MLIRSLIVTATLVALLALFFALRPPDAPQPSSSTAAPAVSIAPAESAKPEARQIRYRIEADTLHGPEVARIVQGQRIELVIDSSADDELHLHGYDLTLPLQAGKPARLAFTADRIGRFVLELHSAHRRIGVLEVVPH